MSSTKTISSSTETILTAIVCADMAWTITNSEHNAPPEKLSIDWRITTKAELEFFDTQETDLAPAHAAVDVAAALSKLAADAAELSKTDVNNAEVAYVASRERLEAITAAMTMHRNALNTALAAADVADNIDDAQAASDATEASNTNLIAAIAMASAEKAVFQAKTAAVNAARDDLMARRAAAFTAAEYVMLCKDALTKLIAAARIENATAVAHMQTAFSTWGYRPSPDKHAVFADGDMLQLKITAKADLPVGTYSISITVMDVAEPIVGKIIVTAPTQDRQPPRAIFEFTAT